MEYDKPPPYTPSGPAYGQSPYPPPQGGPDTSPYPPPQQHVVSNAAMPNMGSTVYMQPGVQPVAPQGTQTTSTVLIVGGCPACRVGILEDDFTCCGICLAIFFFPIGILCCLAMRQKRCANCGQIFS